MKKAILMASAILVCNNSFAQVAEEGSFIMDINYGFPNLTSRWAKLILEDNSTAKYNFKVKNLGPLSIKGDYFLTEKFSLGLEVVYTQTSISSIITRDEVAPGGGTTSVTYTSQFDNTKFRIMPRFGWHFAINDKVDAYQALAVGYLHSTTKYTSTNNSTTESPNFSDIFPIAFRYSVGCRVFFTERLGANFEVGLGGGGLLAAGLTAKIK